MTTRRHVLAAVPLLGVVGLAGCLATSLGSDDPDAGNDDDDSLPGGGGDDAGQTRLEGTGGPGVTLASLDAQPSQPIRIAVDAIRDASDEHPPGLRVSLTNTGESALGVGEGRAAVFAYQSSDEGYLTLLPAEYDAPAEAGCWRLTDGIAVTEEYQIRTIEAGETVSQELSLYASGTEEDACLPVGEHRFESAYTVFADPDQPDDGEQFSWGFSVLLE